MSAIALCSKIRRVVVHRPADDFESTVITGLLAAILPIATPFNDACSAAIKAMDDAWAQTRGVVTVEEGAGEGGDSAEEGKVSPRAPVDPLAPMRALESASDAGYAYLPLHLHVSLVRALFSYEKWTEFQAFLVTAEVRAAVAADVEAEAGTASSGAATADGGTAANALSSSVTASVLAHELRLLRCVYELETGAAIAPLSMRVDTSGGMGATGGAGAASGPDETKKSSRKLVSKGASVGRRGSAGWKATKLPGSGATAGALTALSDAVVAGTRHPLTVFASVRGEMVVDCALLLWRHSQKLTAWLDSRDPGLARSRTTKTEVREANTLCLVAVHAAATKVRIPV